MPGRTTRLRVKSHYRIDSEQESYRPRPSEPLPNHIVGALFVSTYLNGNAIIPDTEATWQTIKLHAIKCNSLILKQKRKISHFGISRHSKSRIKLGCIDKQNATLEIILQRKSGKFHCLVDKYPLSTTQNSFSLAIYKNLPTILAMSSSDVPQKLLAAAMHEYPNQHFSLNDPSYNRHQFIDRIFALHKIHYYQMSQTYFPFSTL
jgi:hypothetical protein